MRPSEKREKMKNFYEFGLSEQMIKNYEELNRNEKIELFPWQKELLNLGKSDVFMAVDFVIKKFIL